jgi:hypothetical protein
MWLFEFLKNHPFRFFEKIKERVLILGISKTLKNRWGFFFWERTSNEVVVLWLVI